MAACGDDPLIPHIVLRNVQALLAQPSIAFRVVNFMSRKKTALSDNMTRLLPRMVEQLLGEGDVSLAGKLIVSLVNRADQNEVAAGGARQSLALTARELSQKNVEPATLPAEFRAEVRAILAPAIEGMVNHPLYFEELMVASALGERGALHEAVRLAADPRMAEAKRLLALNALMAAKYADIFDVVGAMLVDPGRTSPDFRGQVLATLGRLDDPKVATLVLDAYAALEPELKPKALELLTQRPVWSKALLKAIETKAISKDALNVNQVRKLVTSKDGELAKSVRAIWGSVRETRNPGREAVIRATIDRLRQSRGDAVAGAVVFKNVCAQCHKIYGEGQEVGPEITLNGAGRSTSFSPTCSTPALSLARRFRRPASRRSTAVC